MLDNELITLIIKIIIDGEAIAGIPNTPIMQAFQPTKQGVNSQPTAYLFKIGDRRYGSPLRMDKWNETTSTMEHIEAQRYETTFQISTLSTQNPALQNQLTASDLINLIAAILQSSITIGTLQAKEIGILRVMDVRNMYFVDDKGNHAANPSFDFVIEHKQVIKSTTPATDKISLEIITV